MVAFFFDVFLWTLVYDLYPAVHTKRVHDVSPKMRWPRASLTVPRKQQGTLTTWKSEVNVVCTTAIQATFDIVNEHAVRKGHSALKDHLYIGPNNY